MTDARIPGARLDGGGLVGLTFDDGPDPIWTPRVLRALADAGATATFFVIGRRAARHPQLVADIGAGGHELGLHCARHLRHTQSSRAVIERDTVEALRTLDAQGVRPTRWRLPWGARAPWSEEIAREKRLSIVGWSADTHDWRGDQAPGMLAAVEPGLVAGAVVLMHDGLGPGALRRGCVQTVSLVAPLVARIRARSLEPASLALMGSGTPCP